jgi:hypothetical protein
MTKAFVTACGAALLLAGCGGGGGGGGIAATPATGQLTVGLTDGPIDDAEAVVVTFTGLELQRTNGERVQIDFPTDAAKHIDLLALQGGTTGELTSGASVPAGEYQWLRLKVVAAQNASDSYIRLKTGEQYPLWIPSGAETGLKLNRAFTVAQGSITNLLIDFDLRKSIHAPPGQAPNWLLRPTLRMMDRLQVGGIAASVDLQALTAAQLGAAAGIADCRAGLYVFPGTAAAADDMDGVATDGPDPIVYRPVAYDGTSATTVVTIPFLEVGSYQVAATCAYDVDAADTNDYDPNAIEGQPGYRTMTWSPLQSVAVTANATTAVAVPAMP